MCQWAYLKTLPCACIAIYVTQIARKNKYEHYPLKTQVKNNPAEVKILLFQLVLIFARSFRRQFPCAELGLQLDAGCNFYNESVRNAAIVPIIHLEKFHLFYGNHSLWFHTMSVYCTSLHYFAFLYLRINRTQRRN